MLRLPKTFLFDKHLFSMNDVPGTEAVLLSLESIQFRGRATHIKTKQKEKNQ